MNFNAKNLADSWKRWEILFCTYYDAAELHKKKGSTQVAILLHCAGEGALIDLTSSDLHIFDLCAAKGCLHYRGELDKLDKKV